MFSEVGINNLPFPSKTLSLTFDDGPGETQDYGPGPKIQKIAEYLYSEGIEATFFTVGKFIDQYPHILPIVKKYGHLIGNHTYNHLDLDSLFDQNGDYISEILTTEAIIAEYIDGKDIYFRAPRGAMKREVTEAVNTNMVSSYNYKGAFLWDIDCEDWALWRDKAEAETCADLYLREIIAKDRGIILMHDSSADAGDFGAHLRSGNRTFETLLILIPKLKSLGFRFVRLDKIRGIYL